MRAQKSTWDEGRRIRLSRARIAALLTAFVMAVTVLSGPSAASAWWWKPKELPVKYNFGDALVAGVVNGGQASPPGANDWNCKPTAKHPRPVVLVHATMVTMGINWNALSPLLKNDGYCVFALNYGGEPLLGLLAAYGPLEASAVQVSGFVDQVLVATGAAKVDIVGHSQGGTMPRYYINNLGGAAKVANMVGLAPPNNGTDFHGMTSLMAQFPEWANLINSMCGACGDQMAGSDFINALNAAGGTNPAVNYTVITTKYDEIVTPYTSAFLPPAPNVKNITVQDVCWLDYSEHLAIAYDHVALRLVMNALDPSTAQRPMCWYVAPIFGG